MVDSPIILEEGRLGGAAPHLVHPESGFRVWAIEPLGMLTQVGSVTDVDDAVAHFLSVTAFQRLESHRVPGARWVFLHDWRRLTSYTPGARRIMTDWGQRVRADTSRIVIAIAPDSKVIHMGVAVAAMALQLAGFSITVVDDLQAVIDALGDRPRGSR